MFLTDRFQQDLLKEYFGNQRQRERRADNPDALQFGYNDRALDVQRNIVPIKSGNKFLVRLHGEYNILVKLCGNTT